MKLDVLIPCYHSPQPAMLDALNKAIAFSECKCGVNSWGIAEELAAAHLEKRKPRLQLDSNPFHSPDKCPKGKLDIWVAPRVSSCVVQWSRNRLLAMRRPDADYVLFCDDDIVIPEDTIERMLAHGKDIVAGLCTRRIDPPEPNIRQWVEEVQNYGVMLKWPDTETLLEVDAVGTGLILISRKVIETMAMAYHPDRYKADGSGEWFDFVRGPHDAEWGEDISWCWRAQRIGFRIYVDTTITPQHLGLYGYSMADYLPYRDARISGGLLAEEEQKKRRVISLGN